MIAQPALDLYQDGKSTYRNGEYQKAKNLFEKAFEIRKKELGLEDEETIKPLNYLGRTLTKLRENEEALEVFLHLQDLNQKMYGMDSEDEAYCLKNLGMVYNQMYEPKKATESYEAALAILEKIHGRESAEFGDVLMDMAGSYQKMGDFQVAEKLYLQAFELFKKYSEPKSEDFNRIYSNLGYLYRKKGDFEKAVSYGEKALELKLLNYDADHPSVAKYHRNIGKAYEGLNQFEQAKPYFEKTIEIFEKTIGPDHPQTAGCTNEYAGILASLKEYRQALKLLKKGNKSLRKKLPKDHPYVINGLCNIASVYADQSLWKEAIEHYRKALKIYLSRAYPPKEYISRIYYNMAKVFVKQEQVDSALYYGQLGLGILAPDFIAQKEDLLSNPNPQDIQTNISFLRLLKLKAKVLKEAASTSDDELNYLAAALKTVQLAVSLIEKMRNSYASEQSRQFLHSQTDDVYQIGVGAAMKIYNKTQDAEFLWEAFMLSEKSKANLLWSSLNESNALNNAGIPAEEKNTLMQLEKQLVSLEEDIRWQEEKGDEKLVKSLENQLFDINQSYRDQLEKLEDQYLKFYELRYAPPTVQKEQLNNKLTQQSATMIEYFYDDLLLYIFTISDGQLSGTSLFMPSEIGELIQEIQAFDISNVTNIENENAAYLQNLHKLYDYLIAPVERQLSAQTKLVFVPHGIINYVAFETLCSKTDSKNFKKQAYLIHDHPIQYAWSAAIWSRDIEPPNAGEEVFIGFAPFYRNSNVPSQNRKVLSPLTYSLHEVKNAQEYFDGEIFVSNLATESSFKKFATRSSIIHLATHAQIDNANPLNSHLVFAEDSMQSSDSYLHAYEIYQLNLDAELAVMSGCNTAYGQLAKGEGVISLGRAFFYAGCQSVMMSQWLVNDQSSSKLMQLFYKNLANQAPKDEALQQAKIQYLQTADNLTAHPYFWGGMIVVGDMNPIGDYGAAKWHWLWAVLLLITGAVLSAKRKGKKNTTPKQV